MATLSGTVTLQSDSSPVAGADVLALSNAVLTDTFTVTVATDLFTSTTAGHGLVNGNVLRFTGAALPDPLIINKDYFVVEAAADTFKVSETKGGAVLTITTTGTPPHTFTAKVWSVAGSSISLPTTGNYSIDTGAVTGPFSMHCEKVDASSLVSTGKANVTSGLFPETLTPTPDLWWRSDDVTLFPSLRNDGVNNYVTQITNKSPVGAVYNFTQATELAQPVYLSTGVRFTDETVSGVAGNNTFLTSTGLSNILHSATASYYASIVIKGQTGVAADNREGTVFCGDTFGNHTALRIVRNTSTDYVINLRIAGAVEYISPNLHPMGDDSYVVTFTVNRNTNTLNLYLSSFDGVTVTNQTLFTDAALTGVTTSGQANFFLGGASGNIATTAMTNDVSEFIFGGNSADGSAYLDPATTLLDLHNYMVTQHLTA